MQEQNRSRTALSTAYLRAAHQLLDSKPLILDDPIALPLLGQGAANRIQSDTSKYFSSGCLALRSHVLLRSRFAEDQLESALKRGVRQFVLIGAGFDTFCLRQPSWASELTIVEVDHPNTQQRKRTMIADSNLSLPSNVHFADIDFERESLRNGLIRVGVRFDQPTFFSWLGVTMYLTGPAIDATLGCITEFPRGSEAVITFLQPPRSAQSPTNDLANRVSEVGEPFICYFTPEEFTNKLLTAGFHEIHQLSSAQAASYVSENPNPLPIPASINIVSAIISSAPSCMNLTPRSTRTEPARPTSTSHGSGSMHRWA